MKKQIRYCSPFINSLYEYLLLNQIPFERPDEERRSLGYDYLVYSISDQDENYNKHVLYFRGINHITVLSDTLFTDAERNNAEWLSCSAMNSRISLERESDTFSFAEEYEKGKAYHRFLSGSPFYVSRPAKHKASQCFFYAESATRYNLFCDERARQVLSEFEGPILFHDVLHFRTEEPIAGLYFIEITKQLHADAVDLSYSMEHFVCPICGRETYFPPQPPLHIARSALSKMPQICKTKDIFSTGGNISFSIPLVNQEVYQSLVAHKINKGLRFDPVFVFD